MLPTSDLVVVLNHKPREDAILLDRELIPYRYYTASPKL